MEDTFLCVDELKYRFPFLSTPEAEPSFRSCHSGRGIGVLPGCSPVLQPSLGGKKKLHEVPSLKFLVSLSQLFAVRPMFRFNNKGNGVKESLYGVTG